ncbi:MAG: 30S ribosomal protein S6 [Nitrospinaceae bacterium]|nr:30S ribosomal protein S6 [Nitrospinaceae bacterium]
MLEFVFIQHPLFKPMRRYLLLRSYQSVLILKPDIEESRVDEALAKIGEFIKSNGGAILKTEKWGKKRLAYRVKKNRFGVYLNLYHTLEPSGVFDLEKKYKLFDLIIKFMVLHLADDELERALGRDEESDEAEGEKAAGEKAAGEKATAKNDEDKG